MWADSHDCSRLWRVGQVSICHRPLPTASGLLRPSLRYTLLKAMARDRLAALRVSISPGGRDTTLLSVCIRWLTIVFAGSAAAAGGPGWDAPAVP